MKRRIAVIGAGITGLSAAHRITELIESNGLAAETVVYEKSGRAGGVISTIERDGFLIEEGPDMFITTRPEALELARRLGLDRELIETNEGMRRSMILKAGKLYPVPEGFYLMAPSRIIPFLVSPILSWAGKARMLLDLVLPDRHRGDESLASFVRRRFGNEALERIAQPMIGGIYTGDPEKLSLRATMPQFAEYEKLYGSVIRGMYRNADSINRKDTGARYSSFMSFEDGLQRLVSAITDRLPEGVLRLSSEVRSIRRHDDNWLIATDKDEGSFTDVILTMPSFITAKALLDYDRRLSEKLMDIEYASSAVIILAYRREHIGRALDGFGFVVPEAENRDIIACSYSTVKFGGRAPEGRELLRCFAGGAMNPEILGLADEELTERVKSDISQILQISADPLFAIVRRYPKAMPQYHVGHIGLVREIREIASGHKGLYLAGNAYDGVGLPDCISSGQKAAEAILIKAKESV